MRKNKKDKQLEQWLTGINNGILQPNKPENHDFPRCQMLEVENERLRKTISTMKLD